MRKNMLRTVTNEIKIHPIITTDKIQNNKFKVTLSMLQILKGKAERKPRNTKRDNI